MRKIKVPGTRNGDASVYTKKATRTRESKDRNIYIERDKKRSNLRQISSRVSIYFVTIVGSVLLAFGIPMIFAGAVFIWNCFASLLNTQSIASVKYANALKYVVTTVPCVIAMLAIWGLITMILYIYMNDSWRAENISADNSDINDYENDSMIQQPEELIHNYDFVPDAFAHYEGDVTALLSHMHLNNSGLKKWKDNRKIFDEKFSDKLFDSDDVPKSDDTRVRYSPKEMAYNPLKKFGKPAYETAAEVINNTWELPEYENGRPGGVYVVDEGPSNTMVIASTRAGKGQTYIEPLIDTWTRAKEQQNIVINDPKGELYVKFFYPMRRRGMDTIVFNLLDSTHTNIYNPLGYAVQAARQGDYGKMEDFINNVGNVFFPTEGADDPMWPNAAAATFKRSALGLIDYYMEEEAEMRTQSIREKWSADYLARRIDAMWGHVTLYNIYQMMVSLAAKKSTDTALIQFADEAEVEEKDYLSLFFDATERLPKNPLRIAAINNNRTLRTMAGSDKTIASVYGIAMSTMLFFTDDKIARLTSGRLSQNFDMEGLSFPRRFGVRFDKAYAKKKGLNSQLIKWTVYHDAEFKDQYQGKDFVHEDTVDNGWARATFKGKFADKRTYLKLDVLDRASKLKLASYYFMFTKSFERSLSGKTYIKDPVTKDLIVKDGTLTQLQRRRDKKTNKFVFSKGDSLIPYRRKNLQTVGLGDVVEGRNLLFSTIDVHYTERTKGIFMVTPPSKMQYSKLILIMLSQSFDINVDASYMTKANQKPLYTTKYILDEFGNLQSEGKGIPFLQTKESIGLGQSQQYTLILQTLQQLRDVYGDSIDKILQGNTANIVYLKSNDDSMLDTLIGLGGVRHESRQSSKSYSKVVRDLPSADGNNADAVNYTISTSEVPVIAKNDMLFIKQGNAMTFRLGENPIWSKNQLALPFAYQLHAKLFSEAPDYSLKTVPTPSNTDDFDILGNIPDWTKMVEKRVRQAKISLKMMERYMDVYHLDADGLQRLDSELVAIDVMNAINEQIHLEDAKYRQQKAEEVRQAEAYEASKSEYEVDPEEVSFANDDGSGIEPVHQTFDDVEDMSDAEHVTSAVSNYTKNNEFQAAKRSAEKSTMHQVFLGDRNTGTAVTRYEFRQSGRTYYEILSETYDDLRNAFDSIGGTSGWQVNENGELLKDGTLMFRNVELDLSESLDDEDNKSYVYEDSDKSNPDIKWEPTVDFLDILLSGNVARDLLDGRFMKSLRRNFNRKFS